MSPLLWIARLGVVAACAIPVFTTSTRLARDVAAPPLHRIFVEGAPVPRDPVGPIQPGTRFVLPTAAGELSGVALRVATYLTRPDVTYELCGSARCQTTRVATRDNSTVILEFPEDAGDGERTLTVKAVEGGSLALWGERGTPLLQGVKRQGWDGPLHRARDYFHAAGPDVFYGLLALNALALMGIVAISVWSAIRASR